MNPTAFLSCVQKYLVQSDTRQIKPKSKIVIFANLILVEKTVCSCNLYYRLLVTLVCPILCGFAKNILKKKQKKKQQQKNSDESTVDLTVPECCLLHWEGFKRLQDVAMESIFEGTNKARFQWCSKGTRVHFQRWTRWDVPEERAACLLVTQKIWGASIWTWLISDKSSVPHAAALRVLPQKNNTALQECVIHREWDNGEHKTLEWLGSQNY